MEGRIIHDQHRIPLWISATVMEELLNVVLKYGAIGTSLEHTRKKDAILSICWKDLEPAFALILSNLDWCCSQWRPPCPSEPDAFITAGLVYISRLEHNNIKRLQKMSFVKWKAEGNNLILLANFKELPRTVLPCTIKEQ